MQRGSGGKEPCRPGEGGVRAGGEFAVECCTAGCAREASLPPYQIVSNSVSHTSAFDYVHFGGPPVRTQESNEYLI